MVMLTLKSHSEEHVKDGGSGVRIKMRIKGDEVTRLRSSRENKGFYPGVGGIFLENATLL